MRGSGILQKLTRQFPNVGTREMQLAVFGIRNISIRTLSILFKSIFILIFSNIAFLKSNFDLNSDIYLILCPIQIVSNTIDY